MNSIGFIYWEYWGSWNTVLHTKCNKVNGNILKYTENSVHLTNELQKLIWVHLDIYMTVLLEYIGDCSIRVNQSLNDPHF